MCTCILIRGSIRGGAQGPARPALVVVTAAFDCARLPRGKPSQPTIPAYCCLRHPPCCPPAIFCPVSVAFAPRDHLVNWAFIVDFVAGTLFTADVVFNFSCGYVITVGGCGAAGVGEGTGWIRAEWDARSSTAVHDACVACACGAVVADMHVCPCAPTLPTAAARHAAAGGAAAGRRGAHLRHAGHLSGGCAVLGSLVCTGGWVLMLAPSVLRLFCAARACGQ